MDSNKLELDKLNKGERKLATAAIIDSILKAATAGSVITTSLLLPGSTIAFVPLAEKYLKTLDGRQRNRESRRIIAYMKRQNLLKTEPRLGNGLVLTLKGNQRALRAKLKYLHVNTPSVWDGRWRIVFFDIPEKYKLARDSLTRSLKQLGFYQIQRSVWIHPFPAREPLETVATYYHVERYVTYVETSYIDNQRELVSQFIHLISNQPQNLG